MTKASACPRQWGPYRLTQKIVTPMNKFSWVIASWNVLKHKSETSKQLKRERGGVRNESWLSGIFKNFSKNQASKEKEHWIRILYNDKQVNITKCWLNIQMFLSAASLIPLTGALFFHSLFVHFVDFGKSHSLYSNRKSKCSSIWAPWWFP